MGDFVLKKVSEVLKRTKRKTDIAIRFGGDEFVVALPATDLKESLIFAEQLRTAIEGTDICVNGHKIGITISVGVATYIPGSKETSLKSLLDKADNALYDAKKSGRNRVSFNYPFELTESSSSRESSYGLFSTPCSNSI